MSLRSIVVAVALSLGVAGLALAQDQSSSGQQPQQGSDMGGAGMGSMPMHGMCSQMSQMANVTVENTNSGAIVRYNAKDPSQVSAVRNMAQQMSNCMSAPMPAPSAPTQ